MPTLKYFRAYLLLHITNAIFTIAHANTLVLQLTFGGRHFSKCLHTYIRTYMHTYIHSYLVRIIVYTHTPAYT